MKNPFKYLIPAYYNALNGQVVVNGTTLPVYDGIVPPNGAASYILSENVQQANNKPNAAF